MDAQAIYGTVADGASAGCAAVGDCYAVRISAAQRPLPHWDATLLEQLQPAAQQGQTQGWTLHVGDSFSDVPRTNVFYPLIEALLHHGVTGGCGQGGGGDYCPADAVTASRWACSSASRSVSRCTASDRRSIRR